MTTKTIKAEPGQQVRIRRDLHRELRFMAAERDARMSDLASEAVWRWIEEQRQKRDAVAG